MKHVVFKNPGLIPLDAVRTMGLNAKADENAIGHFGTGLKYAISVLLREGCAITMYRGTKKYVFSLKTKSVRGKKFSFVCMNDEQLAFTTELGKNWEPWQAFRELWSNAMDEQGEVFERTDVKREAAHTIIVVTGEPIMSAFKDRHSIVLLGDASFTLPGVEVQRTQSGYIYYRGIRAQDVPKNRVSLYLYNVISQMELTEDRTVKYDWIAQKRIARAILGSNDRNFLKNIFTCGDGYMEHYLDFDQSTVPSDLVLDVLAANRKDLSQGAKSLLGSDVVRKTSEEVRQITVGLTATQQAIYNEAIEICGAAGHVITPKVTFVSTMKNNRVCEHIDGALVFNITSLLGGANFFACTLLIEMLSLNESRGTVQLQLASLVLGVDAPRTLASARYDGDDEMPF